MKRILIKKNNKLKPLDVIMLFVFCYPVSRVIAVAAEHEGLKS